MENKPSNNAPTRTNDEGAPFGLSIEVVPPDLEPSNMPADGKRKRVGFTSDTTPPSPEMDLSEQRHVGDVVQTPDDFIKSRSTQVSCTSL
jgi:hypothetical protein